MQDEKKNENEIEEQTEKEQAETEQTAEQTEELALNMYKRRKRDGKFVSKLSDKELDALQRKKSLFMYLSTLFSRFRYSSKWKDGRDLATTSRCLRCSLFT